MKILVTGAAGFIGFHLAKRLLVDGHEVIGIDNLNDYYDPSLKHARLGQLENIEQFQFLKLDVADAHGLDNLFTDHQFDCVVHLAAQAGVRYSMENPQAYIQSNLVGFGNILECCRHAKISHLVAASSSSVYGANTKVPFSENDAVDHPVSLYAATKRANELMAHSYSSLYQLPITCLRFFTVYGPWGRPDMAYFSFTKAILEDQPIKVFNHGHHQRDFTYIDDVIEGVTRVMMKAPTANQAWDQQRADPANSYAPFKLYNIGNNNPVQLGDFISAIESSLGKQAEKINLDMQPGDVPDTWADCSALQRDFDYHPETPLHKGVEQFVAWYKEYSRE
jgi:UDP-glucuronate 4-epimerase